ncbi:MAG TPA: tetratricopeptide repeat protein, partial [Thermoanaerobaculia bacterium]|nr:tetratricopeptide repeat protein [Thermoanaerobaculia bacterium]
GVVKDQQGKPIEGATVTVDLDGSGPEPTTTNKKGRWSFLGLAHGDWHVVARAEGYVPSEGGMKVYESGAGQALNVTLRQPSAEELAAAEAAVQQDEVQEAVALLEQGNEHLQLRQYAEARAAYQEAMGALPEENHPVILRAIGNSYHAEGNAEQAIASYQQGLEIAPDDPQLLQPLVSILVSEGREQEAEAYMQRLPEGIKMDPNAVLNLGIEAYNQGDMDKAFEYFDRVVRENPEHADGYYFRGLVYINQQKMAEATADLEKFLSMAPAHEKAGEAKEFLAYLQQQ